jgi:hypothetical protein
VATRHSHTSHHRHTTAITRAAITRAAITPRRSTADDEGPQFILPDAALLELLSCPPTTTRALLRVIRRHTAALNAAVAHLPAAPAWRVSAAAQRGAPQLLAMLQGAGARGARGGDAAAAAAAGGGGAAAAAAAAAYGSVDAAAAAAGVRAAAGLPIAVGGVLVAPPDAAAQGGSSGGGGHDSSSRSTNSPSSRKKKKSSVSRSDAEFRERMIKKFSAKTQVGGVATRRCMLGAAEKLSLSVPLVDLVATALLVPYG